MIESFCFNKCKKNKCKKMLEKFCGCLVIIHKETVRTGDTKLFIFLSMSNKEMMTHIYRE